MCDGLSMLPHHPPTMTTIDEFCSFDWYFPLHAVQPRKKKRKASPTFPDVRSVLCNNGGPDYINYKSIKFFSIKGSQEKNSA